ncbi:MAG: ABC transporter ATP-binding protein [Gemmatimonadota bacterium]|nr:MAG: ABC transporter ATP-binding protein [Gemmatimonadota bacterium]
MSDPRPLAVRETDPSGSPTPTLEARGLVREFAGFPAVDGVDFRLDAGSLLAVFGPNGAGKTTLLRILAGILRPTRGQVLLDGNAVDVGDRQWRRRIGVVSHQGFLYGRLTVAENLEFYGRLFGLSDLAQRVPERLAAVALEDRARSEVRTLSRGMRQRLALARALLHDPEVVLLDEPYTGLDAQAASVLREVLSALKDGRRTVVLVTHNLRQGLELADRVAIQVGGRFRWIEDRECVEASTFEALYRDVVEERA